MPKIKDQEFQKMLDDDIKDLNITEGDSEGEEPQTEEGDNDASVRLTHGIDPDELRSEQGCSFEVMQEKPPSEPKHYFDESECYDPDMKDISKAHWNPELNEQDAEIFYDEEAFKKKAESMEDITENKDGGVVKKILQQGQGQVVPKDSLVRIHYNAFHERSKTPFDSSRLRGQEQRFQLGQGDVIFGLDLAVSTMKLNELSCFIVRSDYAYGKMGCGPRIPSNSTIMYEIELVNFILAADGADKFFAMTKRERDAVPFKQILKYVRADKDAASDYFKREMFRDAISRYLRSIKVLDDMSLANAEEETEQQNLMRILYLNVAQCFLNISRPNRTVTYARKALYLNEDDVKALFKLGKAFRLLGDFDKARKILLRAKRQKPMNKDIGDELVELEKNIKRFNEAEREQCRRMFSGASMVDSVSNRGPNLNTSSPALHSSSANDIPSEFKSSVDERIDDFIGDRDLVEILAGNGSRLADFELGYIIERAQSKGLLYRVRRGEMYLVKSPEMMENAIKVNNAKSGNP